ncbi:MAG: PadR family transcriptional regulator [Candidatus Micrarchaeia archaeon]
MNRKKKLPKPIVRLNQSLTISNLWLSILSLANSRPIYAYTLPKEIEKTFSFTPSRLMVYLVLYKLEAEKMLSSNEKGQRKYYFITSYGKKTLLNAKKILIKKAKEL